MAEPEQQKNDQFESQVREGNDIPPEERAKEVGDDEEAENRSMDSGFESVRRWGWSKA